MSDYDVAVLGSGPGGYAAALRAAMRGANVCCIEAGALGGTCLNVGCIPTKAMLHASELFWNMRQASQFGFSTNDASLDGGAFMRRVSKAVGGLNKGVEFLLKSRKVDVIRGRGKLTSPTTLEVETTEGNQQVNAKSIIVATGSRPARPGFLPWDSGRVMTTDEATTAKQLPESVIIIGGGVIGCEFATIYSELGIPVTVLEILSELVSVLDKDASQAISKSLKKRGVRVLTGATITAVRPKDSGVVTELEGGEAIEASCILTAVGREINIEDTGLERLGVESDGGVIKADDRCRTNIENIYAIGDVAETRQYAHLATRMGIIAADNATGHKASDSREVVPVGIYTHPEVASVGLSEAEAKEKCSNLKVSRFPYTASGMAHAYGETEGLVKIMAEADGGNILGALIIGHHATDVVQEVALAMRNNLTVHQIAETIHAHPTFAEAVGEAAEAWLGLPLHVLIDL